MTTPVRGIHHVTCIAGNAQENVDFYVKVMGLRLVKRSVNQDAPDTWHLFYADASGTPGTDLTFFPWPSMPPVSVGHGLSTDIRFAVPPGSIDWWREHLDPHLRSDPHEYLRFGERVLSFQDPHGLSLSLVETTRNRAFVPWEKSAVPVEHQLRGMDSVALMERDLESTAHFLVSVLGFRKLGEEDGWHRYSVDGESAGTMVDLLAAPTAPRGRWGVGGVHHVAWRVADLEEESLVRSAVAAAGRRPTDFIDRFWFTSVYFLEPGGVLFELATDGPGFDRDEDKDALGERLILPPWLEPSRAAIEEALPAIRTPGY